MYSGVSNSEVASRAVLVVDDDQAVREMLQDLLEGESYRVILASNGREALKQLDCHEIGLVLLDLMMPVMDGWQFLETVRQHDVFKKLPVVLLSASRQIARTKNQYGVSAYLTKPFEVETLLQYIKRYKS